ncbi:YlqD family protein [Candidatus Margulisiibacteriota bacterium]
MEKEKKKAKIKSVTLKRTVTIKAIVTEKFKEYMKFELNTAIRNSENRMSAISAKIIELGARPDAEMLRQQLNAEKIQIESALGELKKKLLETDSLEIGGKFTQGTVDGYVSIAEGDNIYEKLGGMEIIAKDGLVQKIIPVAELDLKQ